MGFCTRDVFEGPAPRLLVKEYGAPDSHYKSAIDVYLDGNKGTNVTIDVNTNYQWYVDRPSFNTVPSWCNVTIPSGLVAGYVTDKTITFTDRGDNIHPFPQMFTLILRNSVDPNVYVTINVYRNIKNEAFYVDNYMVDGLDYSGEFAAKRMVTLGAEVHELYFTLHTDQAWQLVVRPTGFNKTENVGDWITEVSVASPPMTAASAGINLFMESDQTGDFVIKVVCASNEAGFYPRFAEIELIGLIGTEVVNTVKIPITQQFKPYLEILSGGVVPNLPFAGTGALPHTVTFRCNVDFYVDLPSWITMDGAGLGLTGPSGAGGDEYTLVFKATDNPSMDDIRPLSDFDYIWIKPYDPSYPSESIAVLQDKMWWMNVTAIRGQYNTTTGVYENRDLRSSDRNWGVPPTGTLGLPLDYPTLNFWGQISTGILQYRRPDKQDVVLEGYIGVGNEFRITLTKMWDRNDNLVSPNTNLPLSCNPPTAPSNTALATNLFNNVGTFGATNVNTITIQAQQRNITLSGKLKWEVTIAAQNSDLQTIIMVIQD